MDILVYPFAMTLNANEALQSAHKASTQGIGAGAAVTANLPALSDFTETATFMDDRGMSFRFVSSPGASMCGDSNLSDRNVTPYYHNSSDDDRDKNANFHRGGRRSGHRDGHRDGHQDGRRQCGQDRSRDRDRKLERERGHEHCGHNTNDDGSGSYSPLSPSQNITPPPPTEELMAISPMKFDAIQHALCGSDDDLALDTHAIDGMESMNTMNAIDGVHDTKMNSNGLGVPNRNTSVHRLRIQGIGGSSKRGLLSVDHSDLDTPISNGMSTPTAATYVYHPHIDQDPFGSTLDSDGHDDGESMMIETVDAAQQLISEKAQSANIGAKPLAIGAVNGMDERDSRNVRKKTVHHNAESIALGPGHSGHSEDAASVTVPPPVIPVAAALAVDEGVEYGLNGLNHGHSLEPNLNTSVAITVEELRHGLGVEPTVSMDHISNVDHDRPRAFSAQQPAVVHHGNKRRNREHGANRHSESIVLHSNRSSPQPPEYGATAHSVRDRRRRRRHKSAHSARTRSRTHSSSRSVHPTIPTASEWMGSIRGLQATARSQRTQPNDEFMGQQANGPMQRADSTNPATLDGIEGDGDFDGNRSGNGNLENAKSANTATMITIERTDSTATGIAGHYGDGNRRDRADRDRDRDRRRHGAHGAQHSLDTLVSSSKARCGSTGLLSPKSEASSMNYYSNDIGITPSPRGLVLMKKVMEKQPVVVWRNDKTDVSPTEPPEFPQHLTIGVEEEYYSNTPITPKPIEDGVDGMDVAVNDDHGGIHEMFAQSSLHSHHSLHDGTPPRKVATLRAIHSNQDRRRPKALKRRRTAKSAKSSKSTKSSKSSKASKARKGTKSTKSAQSAALVIHRGCSANGDEADRELSRYGLGRKRLTMKKRNTTPYGVPSEYESHESAVSVSSSIASKHLTATTIPMLVDTQSVNDRMLLRHRMKLKKSVSNKAHSGKRKRYKKRHSHEPCVGQTDGAGNGHHGRIAGAVGVGVGVGHRDHGHGDAMDDDEGRSKMGRIRSNSTSHSRRLREERRRGVVRKYNALAERRGRNGRSTTRKEG